MGGNILFIILIALLVVTALMVFALLIVGGCRMLFLCVTEFLEEIEEWRKEE